MSAQKIAEAMLTEAIKSLRSGETTVNISTLVITAGGVGKTSQEVSISVDIDIEEYFGLNGGSETDEDADEGDEADGDKTADDEVDGNAATA